MGVRFFNTSGPCVPGRHYMLPPEARLPQARELIDDELYFVVHAPRQTGKTTTLAALARALMAEGRYAALHFSCEGGDPTGDDYEAAQHDVLEAIRDAAVDAQIAPDLLPPDLLPPDLLPPDRGRPRRRRVGCARACGPGRQSARCHWSCSSTRSMLCRGQACVACCVSSVAAIPRGRPRSRPV